MCTGVAGTAFDLQGNLKNRVPAERSRGGV